MACTSNIDIEKYKLYIRDTELSNTEIKVLIEDVLEDILLDTRIFKTNFTFNIRDIYTEYNMLDLFNASQSNKSCKDTYLSVIDLGYYDPESRQIIRSIIYDWFKQIDEYNYAIDYKQISLDTGITYSNGRFLSDIPIIAYVSYKPNLANLDSRDIKLLRDTIIAGIKYRASDLYLNTNNEQVSNLLYQRYYSSKKQLLNMFPQYISNINVRNKEWNT